MKARIDHLVVVAPDLTQGVAWCEATLGVTPGPGGSHVLMGTHNRLLRLAAPDHPRAYFEIIAPEPGKAPEAGRRRWFDMDHPRVQEHLRQHGPVLAHYVVQVPDLERALADLRDLGIERGEAVSASRSTLRGLLSWRISIRPDGERLFDGCLPTLIEWGETHPADAMEDSGLTLQGITLSHPRAAELRQALQVIGLEGVTVDEGPANLRAALQTPRGPVRLESHGA